MTGLNKKNMYFEQVKSVEMTESKICYKCASCTLLNSLSTLMNKEKFSHTLIVIPDEKCFRS